MTEMHVSSCWKFLLAMSLLIGGPLTGSVEARPNTKDFTCEGVRAYLDARGTAVMNTKNTSVYRKFYAPDQQCPFSTIHTAHRVPTKSGMCTLYICREPVEPLFRKW